MEVKLTRKGGTLDAALADLTNGLAKENRTITRIVAGVGRRLILAEAKQIRGTLSMSLHLGRGYKLGASVDKRPTPTGGTVTLNATPAGMWAITEYGTAPHVIKPKRVKAVLAPGFGESQVYAHVTHKGARASHTWTKACAGFDQAELQRIIDIRYAKAMEGKK